MVSAQLHGFAILALPDFDTWKVSFRDRSVEWLSDRSVLDSIAFVELRSNPPFVLGWGAGGPPESEKYSQEDFERSAIAAALEASQTPLRDEWPTFA